MANCLFAAGLGGVLLRMYQHLTGVLPIVTKFEGALWWAALCGCLMVAILPLVNHPRYTQVCRAVWLAFGVLLTAYKLLL